MSNKICNMLLGCALRMIGFSTRKYVVAEIRMTLQPRGYIIVLEEKP
jgi:hypothetical protein